MEMKDSFVDFLLDEPQEIEDKETILYRYNDHHRPTYYRIIKETPCGWWIVEHYIAKVYPQEAWKRYQRWVSKTGKKRFAYPTKEEAWYSYYRRKVMRIHHLECQLRNAKDDLQNFYAAQEHYGYAPD